MAAAAIFIGIAIPTSVASAIVISIAITNDIFIICHYFWLSFSSRRLRYHNRYRYMIIGSSLVVIIIGIFIRSSP